MWGNALGWFISCLIVLATVTSIALVQRSATVVTAPTEFAADPKHGAAVLLPADVKLVVPSMVDPADAGEFYRAALEQFEKDPGAYSQFSRTGKVQDVEYIPAINPLIQATHCSTGSIFKSSPADLINLNNEKPPLMALRTLGDCMIRLGLLLEKDRTSDSLALYEATFALGFRLYEERLTYAEFDLGLTLMAKGSASITQLAESIGMADRARGAREFDQARKRYVAERILPMARILISADQPTLETHFGDVLYFARHAKERMWRIEAIFSLARYRFNAARLGDQNTALKALEEIAATETDPLIRQAASDAKDLTIERYRMLK